MILKQNTDYIIFQKDESKFSFLLSGDIFEFTFGNYLINQFQGSAKEGSANNIWLRIYENGSPKDYPLLGIASGSRICKGKNTLVYSGRVEEIAYTVTFYAAGEGVWLWNVELDGNGETVDVVYGQDIGVANKFGVLTNELYMAQYLDHKIFETENGFVVCSRQNQAQGESFPYLQQGMAKGKAVGYSTDGMQFFGLSYKATHKPEALSGDLPSRNYQFEFSYTALQSEKIVLNGKHSVAFYGLFRPTHEDAVRKIEFAEEIKAAFDAFQQLKEEIECIEPVCIRREFGKPYTSPQWDEKDINDVFVTRKLEERKDGKLLSFFTDSHAHVVLQQKELMVERPHGTIITTKMNEEAVDSHIVSSTNYIYGLFNSQTTVGNTSFHKFLSTARGLLNVLKNSGQRIYVKLGEKYRMLTLPAAYEMGMNYSRWYYVLPDDTLIITSFTAAEQMDIILEVKSVSGKAYDFIITNQIVMGEHEFLSAVNLNELTVCGNKILSIAPDEEKWSGNPYPGMHFKIQMPGIYYNWSDDRIFFEDGESKNGTLLTITVNGCNSFQLIMQGRLEAEPAQPAGPYSFEKERKKYLDFYKKLNAGFHLEKDDMGKNSIEKLNETAWWYSHNAMVHFAAPHGLEQPGGAAWGTRDVCQGPMEYFLATQNNKLARAVLLQVFSHQIWETQEWPQWFMFDKYPFSAGECHGDVVLWPLKCIGDYLQASGDYSILSESIPYFSLSGGQTNEKRETVLEHIKRAVDTIKNRFLENTALISYAGGDWDDTLQPADDAMKEKLVSSWTEALAYQVILQLSETLKCVDEVYADELSKIACEMKDSFHNLLIKDGVIAGFVCREEDASFTYMLHPADTKTGIHYRLLPMTRSIIAEMVDRTQAERNLQLIDENLKCPDGVRLMDKPTRYDGGVSHLFRRAEQAANVGREIGLQYTHAHIRFIEAVAKMGFSDRVWEALLQINPINIREVVPNALYRQSNMYFSSSEGAFMDRYDYSQNFEKLRNGTIEVKGGWRLYSSGPGIYMHQLISNILGIRFNKEGLVIDPVLPHQMDGLRFTFTCFGQETTFVYHIAENRTGGLEVKRNGNTINGKSITNPYRSGGILISKEDFLKETGEIHISLF